MHLRADAKMLTAVVQDAVEHLGSKQYEAKQQAGMAADLSWKAPAKDWEQVCACGEHGSECISYICMSLSALSLCAKLSAMVCSKSYRVVLHSVHGSVVL